MLDVITNMNKASLRTIGLAYKNLKNPEDIDETKDEQGVRNVEKSNFTLLMITGIRDVLRDGVREAVERC